MLFSRFQMLELPLSISLITGKVLRITKLVNAGEISMGYFLWNLSIISRWDIRLSDQSVFLICCLVNIGFCHVRRYLVGVLWWDYDFGLGISWVVWPHCRTNVVCELDAIDSTVINLRGFLVRLWLHIGLEMVLFFDFLHILIETGFFSEHSYSVGGWNYIDRWWLFIVLLARIKLISMNCALIRLFILWISVSFSVFEAHESLETVKF